MFFALVALICIILVIIYQERVKIYPRSGARGFAGEEEIRGSSEASTFYSAHQSQLIGADCYLSGSVEEHSSDGLLLRVRGQTDILLRAKITVVRVTSAEIIIRMIGTDYGTRSPAAEHHYADYLPSCLYH